MGKCDGKMGIQDDIHQDDVEIVPFTPTGVLVDKCALIELEHDSNSVRLSFSILAAQNDKMATIGRMCNTKCWGQWIVRMRLFFSRYRLQHLV